MVDSTSWLRSKEEELKFRLELKNKICSRDKDVLRKKNLDPRRYIFDEKSKLIGCLNAKVGSSSLSYAFLQLKLGKKAENYTGNYMWRKKKIIEPENGKVLEKYLSKQSE